MSPPASSAAARTGWPAWQHLGQCAVRATPPQEIERGRLSQPLLYLSEFIERNRDDYYRGLQRIRTHGDWTGWLHYFLSGVQWSAQRALRQAQQLLALRETMRESVATAPRALALIDALFANPYLDAHRVKTLLGVSDPTARKTLATLQAAGLIEEISGRSWGRQYLARGVLTAIDDPGEVAQPH